MFKQNMSKIFILILGLFFLNANLHAEIKNIIASLPSEFIHSNFDASSSKAIRIKIAKKILVSITTFQSYLPKLTDATIKILVEQEQELNNELKNIENINQNDYLKRSKEFYDNPDYYNYTLRQTIAPLINNLNCIIQSKTVANEMYCWGMVSALLMNINAWQYDIQILIDNHEIPDATIVGQFKMSNVYRIYHGSGLEILTSIVIPYLQNPSRFGS